MVVSVLIMTDKQFMQCF